MSCLGSSVLSPSPLATNEFTTSFAAPSFATHLATAEFDTPLAQNFLSPLAPLACN